MAVTREHLMIEHLKHKGFPVESGDKYIPAAYVPKKVVSLNEVRRRLSKIKGSLADTVRAIRDEE